MCQALMTPGYIKEWLHWPKPSAKKSSVTRMISRKKPRSSACVTRFLRTTPSIMVVLLESLNRVENHLNVFMSEAKMHRQREHLACGAFRFRQSIPDGQPPPVSRLQVHRNRIVHQRADASRLQEGLECFPVVRADHIQMIHVSGPRPAP